MIFPGRDGDSFLVRAPAKVNLGLEVLGRRPDGYHEVRTVLATVDLEDTLRFEVEPDGLPGRVRLTCDDPGVPEDETNLVARAAALLERRFPGRLPALRIHLAKRIPAGRGLGGGSSDAAATLVALDRWFALGASGSELRELAAQIGMDVPFLVGGGTAVAVGRGDRVFPLAEAIELSLVLLIPDFGVSTPAAYAGLPRGSFPRPPAATIRDPSGSGARWLRRDPEALARCLRNDLEESLALPGEASDPSPGGAIRRMRRSLESAGALASAMSGSGSAVFGVFSDGKAAQEAAQRLARTPGLVGCRALACRTIGRMGRGRAARRRILVPVHEGSNPSAPALPVRGPVRGN